MTDIDKLLDKIDKFPYPDTMELVKCEIPGLAFFPGGKGTIKNDDSLQDKGIMILGQDFDCKKNYQKTLKVGHEDIHENPTWRNLLSFLNDLRVQHHNCFFTNAILGIRKGDIGTGKSPAFKDKDFIRNCQMFFLYQLEIQKPKAIFVLGKYVAEFLASTSNDLSCWSHIQNYSAVDKGEKQTILNATFDNGIKSKLVLLTHPSYRPVNVRRRKYKHFSGHEAEINMTNSILEEARTHNMGL